MAIPQGRTGKIWVKKEASFGVEETLAAGNAIRHINRGSFGHQPKNRVNSPEKNPSPGQFGRFDRKPVTAPTGLNALIRPSGSLNTLPESDPFFEAAFGAKTNVTLATTVDSSPTTTGCTVASAGALAVGDAVLLEVTGEDGPFVRILTGVSGADLTWAPALPSAQTAGDDVKGCITYKFTDALAISLTLLHVIASQREALIGYGMDSLALSFPANEEPNYTAGGPAKDLLGTSAAQSAPGAFTTVGTQNPPSGIQDAYVYIDDTEYLIKSMDVDLTNALQVRNSEYGVLLPTELYRNGRREIAVNLDAFAETEAVLKDKARAGTFVSLLNQCGKTEGNIIAVYMPSIDFPFPDQDDEDGEVSWSFGGGVALESALGAGDELTLVFA